MFPKIIKCLWDVSASSFGVATAVHRSSDMCPESYHWQAVLRIFSFSPSDVNMSRREISLTALLQKPQSCFKVAAVFTFVLQLAAVPAVVLPGSWMVFISHLKPERQDTSCALQPATTRTLSSYFYADKTRQDAIPRYSADDSLLTGTVT